MSAPRLDVGVDIGGTEVLGALVDETETMVVNHAVELGRQRHGRVTAVGEGQSWHSAVDAAAERHHGVEVERLTLTKALPMLMEKLRDASFHFIVFIDDLSFDGNDASYKSLKAVLEGVSEGWPDTVILYATSNRPNPRATDMIEY